MAMSEGINLFGTPRCKFTVNIRKFFAHPAFFSAYKSRGIILRLPPSEILTVYIRRFFIPAHFFGLNIISNITGRA